MSPYLEKLIELTGGDTTSIKRHLKTYLEGVNEQIPHLTSSIENSNFHKTRSVVNSLKPLFSAVGFDDLWKKANEIETNVDLNKNFDRLKDQSEILELMLKDSLEAISNYYQTL